MTCGTRRTRGLLINNSCPTRPHPRKKQGPRDATHPLRCAPTVHHWHIPGPATRLPGRFFRLPEISILRYIMHLGLPSGEISESDLRRFTPPRSHASSLPPLHHRHHHAVALLCLPLLLSSRLAETLFDARSWLLQGRIAWMQTYLAVVISRKPLLSVSVGIACACGYTSWSIR